MRSAGLPNARLLLNSASPVQNCRDVTATSTTDLQKAAHTRHHLCCSLQPASSISPALLCSRGPSDSATTPSVSPRWTLHRGWPPHSWRCCRLLCVLPQQQGIFGTPPLRSTYLAMGTSFGTRSTPGATSTTGSMARRGWGSTPRRNYTISTSRKLASTTFFCRLTLWAGDPPGSLCRTRCAVCLAAE